LVRRIASVLQNKRLSADLALLLVAVIWGSAFAAQRVAAVHLGSFLYNGLRFVLATVFLSFLGRGAWLRISRQELRYGGLAGLLLASAATLQQAGLLYTTAGKAGFITSLYVVLVPVLLALVWKKHLPRTSWTASAVAVLGLLLLSLPETWSLNIGDALELVGAGLWASHVIWIGRVSSQVDTLGLSLVQYLVCGVLCLMLGLVFEADTLSGLPAAWWTVAYGGVISVGLGYTLQVFGQKVAPASDAAVLLSMEAVFAALFGWLCLGEVLSTRELIGCALMLAGAFCVQLPALRASGVHQRSLTT
jgi:drug/metabolite transporter (DMT)-like permease